MDDNQMHTGATEELMLKMNLQSTITCPNCGSVKTETMSTDACQFFYDCASCGVRLKPKTGDCCVFCSYGDVPCPPVQEALEKNVSSYEKCEGTAKIMSRPKNWDWLNLPGYVAAALALLAAGGVVCMFCL